MLLFYYDLEVTIGQVQRIHVICQLQLGLQERLLTTIIYLHSTANVTIVSRHCGAYDDTN